MAYNGAAAPTLQPLDETEVRCTRSGCHNTLSKYMVTDQNKAQCPNECFLCLSCFMAIKKENDRRSNNNESALPCDGCREAANNLAPSNSSSNDSAEVPLYAAYQQVNQVVNQAGNGYQVNHSVNGYLQQNGYVQGIIQNNLYGVANVAYQPMYQPQFATQYVNGVVVSNQNNVYVNMLGQYAYPAGNNPQWQ